HRLSAQEQVRQGLSSGNRRSGCLPRREDPMIASGRFASLSLLWKILLSTSVALTALFAITGWIVQNHVINTTSLSLDEEVSSSFQAYESLWTSRAEKLGSVSLIMSGMSDVRAAFSTGDQATIRDTAGGVWGKVSDEKALFLVTDPQRRRGYSLLRGA